VWCSVLIIQTVSSVYVWSTFVIIMLHDTIMTSVDMEHLQPLSRTHQYRKVSACYVFILPICNALVRPSELCRVIVREIVFVCIWPFIITIHCSVLFEKLLLQAWVFGRFLLFNVYYTANFYCTLLFSFQLLILLRTFLFEVILFRV